MIDLETEVRRLVDGLATEPTPVAALVERGRCRRRALRRRVAGGAGAAVAVAAAVVAGVVIPGAGSTPVQVGPAKKPPFPAVPLPAAPAGWSRTAAGTVDLALPPISGLMTTGVGRRSSIEVCVTHACYSQPEPDASYPVVIVPLAGTPRGTPRVIDGLQVRVSGGPQRRVFDVPALGVRLATFGPLGRRIAATMAPSPAVVVASATAAPSVPADWRRVDYHGVSLSVPPTWPVVHLRHLPAAPGQLAGNACALFVHPQLDLGNPPGHCGPARGSSTPPPPAVWLGQSAVTHTGLTTTPLRWVTGADVTLAWDRYGQSYLANLTISTPTRIIHGTIGFGPDPALIEQVVASIRARQAGVTGAAPTSSPPSAAATGHKAKTARLDACGLVSPRQIDTATGWTVTAGRHRQPEPSAPASKRTSLCAYGDRGHGLVEISTTTDGRSQWNSQSSGGGPRTSTRLHINGRPAIAWSATHAQVVDLLLRDNYITVTVYDQAGHPRPDAAIAVAHALAPQVP